jgi:hypothetical protein
VDWDLYRRQADDLRSYATVHSNEKRRRQLRELADELDCRTTATQRLVLGEKLFRIDLE